MKIKMLSTASGPMGSYMNGNTYIVDDRIGNAFVSAGAAIDLGTAIEQNAAEVAAKIADDSAAEDKETAESSRTVKRRGRRKTK